MSTNTIENETIEDQTDQVADTVVEDEPQLGEGPDMTIGPDADDMAEAEAEVVEEFPDTPLSDAESQLIKIQNAELLIREAEAEVEECKSDLKIAKERLERMVDRMRTAASASANDANRPLLPENQPESSADEPGDADPDAWRTIAISILWESEFKGLGGKKIEALIEEVPTLGSFEDLRVQVGDKFEHLSKALPQGIGESLADELENRHLMYVAEWHPEPIEETEPEAEAEADDDGFEPANAPEYEDADIDNL